MEPHLEELRPGYRHGTARGAGRRSDPLRDRGLRLLVAFTASALLTVGLVAIAAALESWWILIPVMAVDLVVTTVVLVTVVRLLDEPD